MMLEEASPSWGEPTLVPESLSLGCTDPPTPADLEATAQGLMSHLNRLVDMMLTGPLAPLCSEEALALNQRLLAPLLTSDKAPYGSTDRGWGRGTTRNQVT